MIKAIVTDIEGTTSSLSFVKDVLFPYARKHIAEFVRQNNNAENVKPLLEEVCREVGKQLSTEEIIEQLVEWINQDKKITPLKALQGLLWQAGYEKGDFKGHIYADAKNKLQEWHGKGIQLYIYSSGSVYAQKLLYGHTDYGDLNYLFKGYFDTKIGAKTEASSYQHIAEQLNISANEILFLSDIETELIAATKAGMQTRWLVRDECINSTAKYKQVPDFDIIEF